MTTNHEAAAVKAALKQKEAIRRMVGSLFSYVRMLLLL